MSMLATEANEFLVRELEVEMREGMERRRPSSNQAKPSHRNTAAYENVEEDLPRSLAHATLGDDKIFSPLSTSAKPVIFSIEKVATVIAKYHHLIDHNT